MKNCGLCGTLIKITYTSGKCTQCRKKANYLNTVGKFKKRRPTFQEAAENRALYEKEYYATNKDVILKRQKAYRINNKDTVRASNLKWYKQNGLTYYRARYNDDICFKLKTTLRSRLNKAIKNNQKTGSAVKDLGCTVDELKKYLESKFTKGMNWENYGEWHIDHVVPLNAFDLTKAEELKKACHYTNLQPLWAKDNLSKGAR